MQTPKCVLLLSLAGSLVFLEAFPAHAGTGLDLARQLNQAFIEVAEKVSPSVVVITVTQKPGTFSLEAGTDGDENSPDALPPDFWRRFHRQFQDQMPEQTKDQGSGIIIRKDGYILTNRHVVENAEAIEVRLLDGRTFKAKVRGVDAGSDLAVIKIDADNLPVAKLADSAKTRVGEFAIAIGAPFAYDYSITFGHVSAKGRSNVIPVFSGGATMDQDFIQTDANINPGNSGGPLLNIDGEVIGINTIILGLRSGIGFAIPSNLAREVADKLIADGKFTRAWLGIEIRAVNDDPSLRELFKDARNGVVVKAILASGPSANSELRAGDVITAVDGQAVGTAQQLRNEVRGKAIGQPVTLDVLRAGKALKLKVKPGEFSEPSVADNETHKSSSGETSSKGLGLTVRALTHELAAQFGVEMTEGVIVVSVDKSSPAARNGIKPGDIITSIMASPNNSQAVTNPKEFADAVKKADLKKGIIVNLQSSESVRFEILKEGEE
jgi:serine protease Do